MTEPRIEVITEKSQSPDQTFPHLSKAIIERLERLFPNACPTLTMKDREVWFRCGQVDVVRFLRREYERQREDRSKG
jgi:hypothetical protein